MKKQIEEVAQADAPALPDAPRKIDPSMIDLAAKVRVVDAETGKVIDKVISADADAGVVRRYAVERGNLVREGDHFQVIKEDRAIRIEWIEAPTA